MQLDRFGFLGNDRIYRCHGRNDNCLVDSFGHSKLMPSLSGGEVANEGFERWLSVSTGFERWEGCKERGIQREDRFMPAGPYMSHAPCQDVEEVPYRVSMSEEMDRGEMSGPSGRHHEHLGSIDLSICGFPIWGVG